MPPRTAKSPCSMTVEARLKPMSVSQRTSASTSTWRPTAALKLSSRRMSRAGTSWVAAATVVRMTEGRSQSCDSVASVAMRAALISGFGETRS